MNKPVCGKCKIEMNLQEVSVVALYMVHNPPLPFQAHYADLYKCKKCSSSVLSRFSSDPFWTHFDTNKVPNIHSANVFPIYESVQ